MTSYQRHTAQAKGASNTRGRRERINCVLLAVVTLLFGVAGASTLPSGHLSDTGFVVVAAVSATSIPVAALWLRMRWPGKVAAVAFVVYADVGVAASMTALPGCALFLVIALFCVVATSRRVMAAHLFAAVGLTVVLGGLAIVEGSDTWIVVARFIINIALLSTPGFLLLYIDYLRRQAERAQRDPLTGLWNRRGLFDAVDDASSDLGSRIGVTVVDIDAFKAINDSLGHSAGDGVLLDVADRLATAVPNSEAARLGGDEFAVVHFGDDIDADHGHIAAVLDRAAQGTPFTASTGFASRVIGAGDRPSSVVRQLIAVADLAMYRNKGLGSSPVRAEVVGTEEHDILADDRARITDLIAGGGPDTAFQPICHADGLHVAGYEALSRFPRGLGPPVQWFRRAARAGVGEALELAAVGRAAAHEPALSDGCFLTLNLSAATIRSFDITSVLAPLADRRRILLEITEYDLVGDYDALRASMQALRSHGIEIAIDDVGAGYSTLRHIIELEPSMIKIDYSLVHKCDLQPHKHAAVTTLTSFGHRIGATVVAEGIENAAEHSAVLAAGVDYVQGFHIGTPARIG